MTDMRKSTRQNHVALAQQVVAHVLERGLSPGDRLPEQSFAEACGVSRTPIRSAFKILEKQGILAWREDEGYHLALSAEGGLTDAAGQIGGQEQDLADRILADRAARRIPDAQSVSALARRYAVSRIAVLNTLKILSRDGVATQLPGRAWEFQPLIDTPRAISESLSFRLTVEPQAILAPGFQLDRMRAGALRGRIRDYLALPDPRLTAAGFRRLDIDFHMLIAECSGNRFLRGALLAHHRLRHLGDKDAAPPAFRLRQAMEEHLDILDSLERHQFELAADQMVLHLRRSGIRRPEAATRGIPPLTRGPHR